MDSLQIEILRLVEEYSQHKVAEAAYAKTNDKIYENIHHKRAGEIYTTIEEKLKDGERWLNYYRQQNSLD